MRGWRTPGVGESGLHRNSPSPGAAVSVAARVLPVPMGFEIATGTWVGTDHDTPPLSTLDSGVTPRAALEEVLLSQLARPPCIISFSGGRDSSTLLAIAVSVARQKGLPLPVPASLSFSSVPAVDETSWQEVVIRHLGVDDWFRRDIDGELELLEQILERAADPARRAGNPLHARARAVAGTSPRWIARHRVLRQPAARQVELAACRERTALRSRPEPRDALRLALSASPPRARRAALSVRHRLSRGQADEAPPWLRPGPRQAFAERQLADLAGEPARWDRRVAWCARWRGRAAIMTDFAAFGAEAGAHVVHPFADLRFLAAIARAGGRAGFGGRTQAMQALAGDLLPERVLLGPLATVPTWDRCSGGSAPGASAENGQERAWIPMSSIRTSCGPPGWRRTPGRPPCCRLLGSRRRCRRREPTALRLVTQDVLASDRADERELFQRPNRSDRRGLIPVVRLRSCLASDLHLYPLSQIAFKYPTSTC